MRLIDADKLPEVNTIERIEGNREVFVNSWVPASAIWKAPTVEAIPIEWLRKYVDEHDEIVEEGLYWIVEGIIDDWEEENGTDRQEQTP